MDEKQLKEEITQLERLVDETLTKLETVRGDIVFLLNELYRLRK